MEFSRQEYGIGLPFPSPGNLPEPRIEPGSPELLADSLPSAVPSSDLKKVLLKGQGQKIPFEYHPEPHLSLELVLEYGFRGVGPES